MNKLIRLVLPVAVAGATLLGCSAGKFDKPLTLGGDVVAPEKLNRGYEGYTLYCLPCHGENGDGKGLSATGLRPPPRDFTQGLFKFGGVAAPALPPDSELRRIVRGGLHGTAMLPWDVNDSDLTDILAYIKTFSPKWQQEKPGAVIETSADPYGAARRDEAITLGAKLYHAKAQCNGCHPSYLTHEELFKMAGQSEFSAEMYHSQLKESEYCLEWKPGWTKIEDRECIKPVKVMPPDFTRDNVRNVRLARNQPPNRPEPETVTDDTTTKDLYRTIASGIGGANMPTWKGALKEEEIWGLVYYTKSLIALNDPTDAKAKAENAALHSKLADGANLTWAPPKPPEPVVPAPGAPGAPGVAPPAGAAPAAPAAAAPTAVKKATESPKK